jgi:signal peptidase II
MKPRRYVIFSAVAAFAVVADQVTKAAARMLLAPERIQPFITGFWDWNLSYNEGVAFSIGNGSVWARALFSAVAALACVAIVVVVKRSADARRGHAAALGLLFAGALGNLIDRVVAGKVTDFILWRAGDHRWPRFNVADAALVVGVAGLLVSDLIGKRTGPGPHRAARSSR